MNDSVLSDGALQPQTCIRAPVGWNSHADVQYSSARAGAQASACEECFALLQVGTEADAPRASVFLNYEEATEAIDTDKQEEVERKRGDIWKRRLPLVVDSSMLERDETCSWLIRPPALSVPYL